MTIYHSMALQAQDYYRSVGNVSLPLLGVSVASDNQGTTQDRYRRLNKQIKVLRQDRVLFAGLVPDLSNTPLNVSSCSTGTGRGITSSGFPYLAIYIC